MNPDGTLKRKEDRVPPSVKYTRLCIRYMHDECRTPNCTFAHGIDKLRVRPDLSKTRLCRAFQATRTCANGNACRYAHGEEELRATADLYKTKQCPEFQQGNCFRQKCRYAHGIRELRASADLTTKPAYPRASTLPDTEGLSRDFLEEYQRLLRSHSMPLYPKYGSNFPSTLDFPDAECGSGSLDMSQADLAFLLHQTTTPRPREVPKEENRDSKVSLMEQSTFEGSTSLEQHLENAHGRPGVL
ncbi:MAG: uncharacterized protein KVP18_003732 [Porospora cf. gigantea A]|uniref:uncharacterized protein n=1 Tax=Porospora cf. gigantea A TaxID=2853593 RepID=UPI003559542A|nr:MAG: hypothetical protein KVP18_003732 [Porospora cf. gigantea A]